MKIKIKLNGKNAGETLTKVTSMFWTVSWTCYLQSTTSEVGHLQNSYKFLMVNTEYHVSVSTTEWTAGVHSNNSLYARNIDWYRTQINLLRALGASGSARSVSFTPFHLVCHFHVLQSIFSSVIFRFHIFRSFIFMFWFFMSCILSEFSPPFLASSFSSTAASQQKH